MTVGEADGADNVGMLERTFLESAHFKLSRGNVTCLSVISRRKFSCSGLALPLIRS